jgi:hypothetical protein
VQPGPASPALHLFDGDAVATTYLKGYKPPA